MDIALKPVVVEFLIEKGYKYFSLYTVYDEKHHLHIRFTPRVERPKHFRTGEYSFFEISRRDYRISYGDKEEWVILDLPNADVPAFIKWELKNINYS